MWAPRRAPGHPPSASPAGAPAACWWSSSWRLLLASQNAPPRRGLLPPGGAPPGTAHPRGMGPERLRTRAVGVHPCWVTTRCRLASAAGGCRAAPPALRRSRLGCCRLRQRLRQSRQRTRHRNGSATAWQRGGAPTIARLAVWQGAPMRASGITHTTVQQSTRPLWLPAHAHPATEAAAPPLPPDRATPPHRPRLPDSGPADPATATSDRHPHADRTRPVSH